MLLKCLSCDKVYFYNRYSGDAGKGNCLINHKATETASEVEQKAKEMAGEVREIGSELQEATMGAAEIFVLALVVGCIGAAMVALLLMVAII
jgi:hypothetical protein